MSLSHSHSHGGHGHEHSHGGDEPLLYGAEHLPASVPSEVDPNSILSANKAFFDSYGSTYSQKHSHRSVAAAVASAITKHVPLDEETMRLLDYACGTGLISQALLPHVASVVGIDISTGMVAAYNAAAEQQGLTREEMHAVTADITVPNQLEVGENGENAAYGDFDVAVCVLAFHHMPDPAGAAKAIATRIKTGGRFVLVDFRRHEDLSTLRSGQENAEKWKHIVAHNGFDEEQVRGWFKDAGVGEPQFVEVGTMGLGGAGHSMIKPGEDGGEDFKVHRSVFMAVGKKE